MSVTVHSRASLPRGLNCWPTANLGCVFMPVIVQCARHPNPLILHTLNFPYCKTLRLCAIQVNTRMKVLATYTNANIVRVSTLVEMRITFAFAVLKYVLWLTDGLPKRLLRRAGCVELMRPMRL